MIGFLNLGCMTVPWKGNEKGASSHLSTDNIFPLSVELVRCDLNDGGNTCTIWNCWSFCSTFFFTKDFVFFSSLRCVHF